MFSTRRFAAPIAALILALTPATVLAQSAGDDQYSDPFGDDEQSQGSGGSGGSGSGGSGGSGSSGTGGSGTAGSTSSGSAAQATPSTAAPVAPAASGTAAAAEGGELPRTGLDAGLVAAIGAGLLGMGLVLRRRTADARR